MRGDSAKQKPENQREKKNLSLGAIAPEFCLSDPNGKTVCLSDFRGKWVVLYFYPKDNTSGCTREAIDFTKSLSEFEKLGAVVIGVSPDSAESHTRFRNRHNLKVLLLSDADRKVLSAYGAMGLKKVMGKERTGVIRSTFLIDPNGKVARIWSPVTVAGHAEEVLETLRAQ